MRSEEEQSLPLAGEAQFRVLAETASDAIITIDKASRMLFVNPAAERIFGYTRKELLGQNLTMLMPEYLRHLHEKAVDHYLETGHRHINWLGIELPGLHKSGEEIALEVSFGEAVENGQATFTGIIRDVTERKRLERRRAAQYAVTSVLAESSSLDDATPRLLQAICESTGWQLGELWFLDKQHEVLRNAGSWLAQPELTQAFLEASRETTFRRGAGLPGRVWASEAPAWVHDVKEDPNFPRVNAATKVGLSSAVAFPLHAAGSLTGVLEFFSTSLREPDPDLLQMMEAFGKQIGVFIERTRALTALQEAHEELETRVKQRTAELEATNKELEAFSYSVSHDLRGPLRGIDGFSRALLEDYASTLDSTAKGYLERIISASERMGELIDDLLELSRLSRAALRQQSVNLSEIAQNIVARLRENAPHRQVAVRIEEGLVAVGDARLLTVVLENLLENAWKFTAKHMDAQLEVNAFQQDDQRVFFVRDNGAGFDMTYANKLFAAFQRLHDQEEFKGTGIGLATVQRIIHRHGGRIWADGEVGKGATFYFTLP
jgi:PAS domain S-box-containing protein